MRRTCAWYGSGSDLENASKDAEAMKRPSEPLARLSRQIRHLCQCCGVEPELRPSASPASARPDADRPPGNSLHCAQLPPADRLPSLRRQGRGTPTLAQRARVLVAAVLAAALFTLVASIWPDLLGHLRGVGGDPSECPICAARHAAQTGAPTIPVPPVFTLLVAGPVTLQHQSSVPALAILTLASRAPPVVG